MNPGPAPCVPGDCQTLWPPVSAGTPGKRCLSGGGMARIVNFSQFSREKDTASGNPGAVTSARTVTVIISEKTVRTAKHHAYETFEGPFGDTEKCIDDLLEEGHFDDIADIINENLAMEIETSVELGLSRILRP